jgi:lipopolysaccharide transport system ATP-binding protein
MSETVIRVENLSKHYVLGKNGGSVGLRHVIHDVLTAPLRWRKNPPRPSEPKNGVSLLNRKQTTDFWALKNVSFEVKQGEVVGIIGRNGAGKSTLLKILSRITEQTEGRIEISGRVASLLEVGTGFHPELTGRENIFLNGAILGMSRAEIKRKFDEIVAFSEVEKFLDTPVKRYSSGMYVRLAFAVAAHLEPEILIVDEVLAVGDAEFQKKCLGKMQDVSQGGRTVLFVSHNMAVVNKLCHRCVYLTCGQVVQIGKTSEVVDAYVGAGTASGAEVAIRPENHLLSWGGTSSIQLLKVRLLDPEFNSFQVRWQQPIRLELEFEVKNELKAVIFSLAVMNMSGLEIFGAHSSHETPYALNPGVYRIELEFQNPLRAGLYHLAFGADYPLASVSLFHVARAVTLEVLDVGLNGKLYPQWGNVIVDVEAAWYNLGKLKSVFGAVS